MSLAEKLECIDSKNETLSISRQCELLRLARSSFYRPRSDAVENSENTELMKQIDEEYLSHPFYGSRR